MEKTVEIFIGQDRFHAQVVHQSLRARGFDVQLWEADITHGQMEEHRLVVWDRDRDAITTFLEEDGLATT